MAKVHPNHSASKPPKLGSGPGPGPHKSGCGERAVMTVWRKSLMFNCKGFAVFDAKGALLYRVDNYSSASTGEIVLMDASGKCLMTVRRKRLSLGESWVIYDGEEAAKPCFSVKKHVTLLPSKELAHVTSRSGLSYTVEGSYSRRCCTVYDGLRRPLVEVERKEAASGIVLGGDVFRLTVLDGFDVPLAMAMVIVLEQMFH